MSAGNLARSSLICKCVYTKEKRHAALTHIMSPAAHSHSTLQPVCPLFLIVLRSLERKECPCWLKTGKLCHPPVSYVVWAEFSYSLLHTCRSSCLGDFSCIWSCIFILVLFFLHVSNGCSAAWVSSGPSSSNQHRRHFWHNRWCWDRSMHWLAGEGVGIQPILMLIEESSCIEELMRYGGTGWDGQS